MLLLENVIIESASADIRWFPRRSIYLGVDKVGRAVVMPLLNQTQGPQVVSMTDLRDALHNGTLKIDSASRPPLPRPDELSNAAKKEYDAWMPHFQDVVTGEGRARLLEKDERFELIARIARATNRPKLRVRRMLYRILRAGRHLHGLCYDYANRGGLGKKQKPGTNKRGRKPSPGSITGERPASDFRTCIEAAVADRVIATKEQVAEAYRKMLAKDFTRTITMPNGRVKTQLVPESQRPTIKQFRIIADEIRHKGLSKTRIHSVKSRQGGSAKDGVLGPGYRYEIDATGGQLELVSEFDLEQPIGPANAYGLLDVWSTACVGGVMGVFNAGYKAAQVALFNTFTSKKELCARWDIELEEAAWPCHHVPHYITSDRGELVSDAAEALPAEFNVILQTAAPYNPQMKGTIEGWFNGLKSSDIRKLVGFGRKGSRMQRDPKRDAALTRYDAARAFLLLAIAYNHRAAPKSAIPPQMLELGYEKISRITLWQWGLRNMIPCARIEPKDAVYTALLRKTDASIRENGLFVEGVRYISAELRAAGLLQRAAQYGAIAVQATVDDYLGNTVWYRTDPDAPWLPAYLADPKLLIYNATFSELAEQHRKVKVVYERSQIEGAAIALDTESQLRKISDDAVKRQRQQSTKPKPGVSKNVRVARTADAQNERREHGAAVMQSYAKANLAQGQSGKPKFPAPSERQKAVSMNRLDLVKSAFLKPEVKS